VGGYNVFVRARFVAALTKRGCLSESCCANCKKARAGAGNELACRDTSATLHNNGGSCKHTRWNSPRRNSSFTVHNANNDRPNCCFKYLRKKIRVWSRNAIC
jgi:hypothetical protein